MRGTNPNGAASFAWYVSQTSLRQPTTRKGREVLMQIVSRVPVTDAVHVRRTNPRIRAAHRDDLATVPCFGMELLERRVLYAAGDLDPGFDDDGWTVTPRPGESAETANQLVRDVLVEPDGRTIVLSDARGFQQVGLYRYNADGSLDTTFGDGGTVYTDVSTATDLPVSITRLTDGKYLVVGNGDDGGEAGDAGNIFLVRYNADGTLDDSFGNGGVAKEDFGLEELRAISATVNVDGSITLAGQCRISPHQMGASVLLARFNSDGTLDTSLGVRGRVTAALPQTTWAIDDVEMDADGNALVLYAANGTSYVSRLRANGSIDRSFADHGMALIEFAFDGDGTGRAHVTELAMLDDGAFLVSGVRVRGGQPSRFGVARFNADGSPDLSFGDYHGITLIGENVSPGYVAVQPDGKIVLGGTLTRPHDDAPLDWADFALARLNPDGSPDVDFGGGDGVVTSDLNGFEQAWAIGVGADGKIVLAGNTLGGDLIVARYDGGAVTAPSPRNEPEPDAPVTVATRADRLFSFANDDAAARSAFSLLSATSSDLLDGEADEDDLLTI